jgi:hypothetical protein
LFYGNNPSNVIFGDPNNASESIPLVASCVGNFGGVHSEAREWMGREHSIVIHLPPLATLAFKLEK